MDLLKKTRITQRRANPPPPPPPNICIYDLDLWSFTSKINRFHPLLMIYMFAKFDEDSHNGLISIMFTMSKRDRCTHALTKPSSFKIPSDMLCAWIIEYLYKKCVYICVKLLQNDILGYYQRISAEFIIILLASLFDTSRLWFAGVRECPPWCSIVGATVTVHQFFCILHLTIFQLYMLQHIKKYDFHTPRM